jgi:hypothetical protein
MNENNETIESDKELLSNMKKLFLAFPRDAEELFNKVDAVNTFYTPEAADEWFAFVNEYWENNR